jgi:hypothetical protein
MHMDSLAVLAAILAWLLILGVALLRVPGVGLRALAGPWLVLSVVSMGCVFMVFFIVSYGLLFAFGRAAAAAGVVMAIVAMGATPVAWAFILRRRARRTAANG